MLIIFLPDDGFFPPSSLAVYLKPKVYDLDWAFKESQTDALIEQLATDVYPRRVKRTE